MAKVAYLADNLGSFADPTIEMGELMHRCGHNVGNFAFWNATRLLFAADVHCFPFGATPDRIHRDTDFIVIPAANFLNPTSDLGWLADILQHHDKPCVVVGLGAQSEHESAFPELTPGTVRFLLEASRRTPFIGVRGAYTAELCARHGVRNIRVLGCPSLLTNGDRRLAQGIQRKWRQPVEKLAIHAAALKAHVRPADRFVCGLLQRLPGSSYGLQRPVELMKLARGIALTEQELAYVEKARTFLCPDIDAVQFRRLLRACGFVPYSVDAWRFHLAAHSHSLGTRIHGAMLSLSAGLPTICITHDTRTRELCAVMQVPSVDCARIRECSSVGELFEQITIDPERFEDNRSAAAHAYRDLLDTVGLDASTYLCERF